jgi:hypothetical protein
MRTPTHNDMPRASEEPKAMLRLLTTTLLFAFLMAPGALKAASVKVSGDAPRRSITVEIDGATVGAVLEDLRTRYRFEVSGLGNAANGDALTMTISGNLRDVLGRLLRNRNHMIVRSADNASGIAKVMILNSTYGAGPKRPDLKRAIAGTGFGA